MKVRIRRLFVGIMLIHAFGLTVYIIANGVSLIRSDGSNIELFELHGTNFTDFKRDTPHTEDILRDRVLVTSSTLNINILDLTNGTAGECNPQTIVRPGGYRFGTADDWWQSLDTDKRMHLFSAYLHNDGREIRVIGLKIRQQFNIECQLWYDGTPTPRVQHSVATVKQLADGGRRYASTETTCPLPDSRTPTAVSLVTHRCATPANLIQVRNVHPPTEPKYEFTLCVSPLNYHYSRAYELVEWIELNRILGAEHFVFYNYSTGPNVDEVLAMYMRRGLVSVVQWALPMSVDKWPPTKETIEVNYFAQAAAINDCLMRNRWTSKYLVYMDLDEFIIPHENGSYTWSDMLKGQPHKAAYSFQSSFFRKEWNTTTLQYTGKDLAIKYRLVTLTKLHRENNIFKPMDRSKYLLRPSLVETVGVHIVSRYSSGQSGINVSPNTALVHHYRIWINPIDHVAGVSDDTALKYKSDLIANVDSVWSDLQGVEIDRPIV